MTKQTTAQSLEQQQIAQALTNSHVTLADLDELISKTEEAVAEAAATAQAEREKALDPIASPDAAKAEQSAWAAELRRDRLRSSLVRLWERLHEVERVESTGRWKADYEGQDKTRRVSKGIRRALFKTHRPVMRSIPARQGDRSRMLTRRWSGTGRRAPATPRCRAESTWRGTLRKNMPTWSATKIASNLASSAALANF